MLKDIATFGISTDTNGGLAAISIIWYVIGAFPTWAFAVYWNAKEGHDSNSLFFGIKNGVFLLWPVMAIACVICGIGYPFFLIYEALDDSGSQVHRKKMEAKQAKEKAEMEEKLTRYNEIKKALRARGDMEELDHFSVYYDPRKDYTHDVMGYKNPKISV